MPKISICVTYTDNDAKNIYSCIDSIRSSITDLSYEIIIIANCKDKNNIISINDIRTKTIIVPYEKGLLHCRQIACEYITGEYVWYIDVDDSIIGEPSPGSFHKDPDIICFNSNLTGVSWNSKFHRSVSKKNNVGSLLWENNNILYTRDQLELNNLYNISGFQWALWRCLIKTDLFKEILKLKEFGAFYLEDVIIVHFLLNSSKCKSIRIAPDTLYYYQTLNKYCGKKTSNYTKKDSKATSKMIDDIYKCHFISELQYSYLKNFLPVKRSLNLAIGIIFCDNDIKYLDTILDNIETRIKIPHSIYVVDNCKSNSVKNGYRGITVFKGGGLHSTAVQIFIKNLSNTYLWIIDPDDEIIKNITRKCGLYNTMKYSNHPYIGIYSITDESDESNLYISTLWSVIFWVDNVKFLANNDISKYDRVLFSDTCYRSFIRHPLDNIKEPYYKYNYKNSASKKAIITNDDILNSIHLVETLAGKNIDYCFQKEFLYTNIACALKKANNKVDLKSLPYEIGIFFEKILKGKTTIFTEPTNYVVLEDLTILPDIIKDPRPKYIVISQTIPIEYKDSKNNLFISSNKQVPILAKDISNEFSSKLNKGPNISDYNINNVCGLDNYAFISCNSNNGPLEIKRPDIHSNILYDTTIRPLIFLDITTPNELIGLTFKYRYFIIYKRGLYESQPIFNFKNIEEPVFTIEDKYICIQSKCIRLIAVNASSYYEVISGIEDILGNNMISICGTSIEKLSDFNKSMRYLKPLSWSTQQEAYL